MFAQPSRLTLRIIRFLQALNQVVVNSLHTVQPLVAEKKGKPTWFISALRKQSGWDWIRSPVVLTNDYLATRLSP